MANNSKILFKIDGDASGAINALSALDAAVSKASRGIVKNLERTSQVRRLELTRRLFPDIDNYGGNAFMKPVVLIDPKQQGILDRINAKLLAIGKNISANLGAKAAAASNVFDRAIVKAYTKIEGIERAANKAFVAGYVAAAKRAVVATAYFAGKFPNLYAAISRVGAVASTLSARVKSAFSSSSGSVASFANSIAAKIPAGVAKVTASINTLAANIQSKVPAAFSTMAAKAKSIAGSLSSYLNSPKAPFGSQWTKNLQRNINNVRSGFQSMVDSLRLSTQALTTFGRVMMYTVSLPFAAFMGGMTNSAINFEDAMVRVQKTTSFSEEAIDTLSTNLRDLAKTTSTSHDELARIAEIIGQMAEWDDDDVGAISNLTRTLEMFVVATDLTAEEVTDAMGRIANAFGWDITKSSGRILRLSNVINQLENTTAASAREIITATTDWSQAAYTLGISSAEAAAFSASLISMGFSAEEAGTSLRNIGIYLIDNIDAVHEALKAEEAYSTLAKTRLAIEENASLVIQDIVAHADELSAIESLPFLKEIANLRGGRGLIALSNNVDLLKRNLEAANSEWINGKSLLEEYERAMTSSKNQVGILKNNINDLGITLGDAILPALNQAIQILVPAIQFLAEQFKGLDKVTQVWVIAAAAAVIVAGPLLFVFGQLAHGASLLLLGFGQLLKIVPALVGGLSKIIGVGKFLAPMFMGWGGLVFAAVATILAAIVTLNGGLAKTLGKIADAASGWGSKIAKSLAEGFLGGAVRFIVKALRAVANLFASFFKGHSPPKEGPLSTIDKWGAKVMQAYLQGFKNADFSILSEVGGYIENALTRGVSDEGMPQALRKVAKARNILAELVSGFNETGVVDEGLLSSMTKGLGLIKDNVKELVRVWLKYNDIQEDLAALEERRKQNSKAYKEEIALISSSNMSIEEKVANIRAAQRANNDTVRGYDAEQEALEEQASGLQENMEYQQNMIDAMQEQQDLLQSITDAVKSLADAMSDLGGGGGGGGDLGEGMGDVQAVIDEVSESWGALVERFSEGKRIFQGFLDAWYGKPNQSDELISDSETGTYSNNITNEPVRKMYNMMYSLGTAAKDARDFIAGVVTQVQLLIDKLPLPDPVEQKKGGWGSFTEGLNEGFGMWNFPDFEQIGSDLKTSWDKMWGTFETVDSGEIPANFWEWVGQVVGGVGGGLSLILSTLPWAGGNFFSWLFDETSKMVSAQPGKAESEALQTWIDGIGPSIETGLTNLEINWNLMWEAIGKSFTDNEIIDWWEGLGGTEGVLSSLNTGWNEVVAGVGTWGSDLVTGLVAGIGTGFANLAASFTTEWGKLATSFTSYFGIASPSTLFAGYGGAIVQGLLDGITGAWQGFIDAVVAKLGEFTTAVTTFFGIASPSTLFATYGGDIVQGLIDGITGLWQTLIDDAGEKMTTFSDTLGGYVDAFFTVGQNLGQGFINGISSLLASIAAKAPEPFGSWLKKIVSGFGIASPSKVMFGVGADVGAGFMMGVDSEVSALETLAKTTGAFGAASFAPAYRGPSTNYGYIGELNININNPVVRDDRDIDRIVEQLKRELAKDITRRSRFGGNLSY